ncbi:unnamed protein product [Penicillium salamii]|uniref:Zn(2)-C6 fungal-type domain-containing protein n=1 Tax=Penicillium salamii TaxID=1612424 RepID=A0A9W4I7D1_9EURO|nr:unnamed protein product [Penicillium salamii]
MSCDLGPCFWRIPRDLGNWGRMPSGMALLWAKSGLVAVKDSSNLGPIRASPVSCAKAYNSNREWSWLLIGESSIDAGKSRLSEKGFFRKMIQGGGIRDDDLCVIDPVRTTDCDQLQSSLPLKTTVLLRSKSWTRPNQGSRPCTGGFNVLRMLPSVANEMYGNHSKRKTRTQHSNSRSGCQTCKTRRKKCDETHPACLRCLGSGKQCDGYGQTIDKRTREWRDSQAGKKQNHWILQARSHSKDWSRVNAIFPPLVSACKINLHSNEKWCLDFYYNRIAMQFWHYFRSTFWNGLVLQMCENYPAVRHAVIAMGAWYAHLEGIPGMLEYDRDPGLALYHSTKAITCLRESLATPHISNRTHKQVVIVTCLTFIVLVLLQGDFVTARNHLISGYKLFKEWDIQEDQSVASLALRQVFAQLHVHWFFCSHSELLVKSHHNDDENSHYRYSALEVMNHILELSDHVSRLMLDQTTSGFSIGPASSFDDSAADLVSRLRVLRTRLATVLIELNGLMPKDCASVNFFSLWIDIIEIKLTVAKSQRLDEKVYDDHLERFQRIAKLIQALAGLDPDSDPGPTDIEISGPNFRYFILPAVIWSASKCRDWQVRQDMCSILRERSGNDYWISATSMALKRLLDIESAGVKPGDSIPEAARAYLVNVTIHPGQSKVELRYRRPQYVSDFTYSDEAPDWEIDSMYY